MKAKTIKIKTLEEGLTDFSKAFHKASTGQSVKNKSGIFFSSLEAVRKILTTERIKMLRYIKKFKPNSIYELAKGLDKNIKNVSQDLQFLADVGVVEMQASHKSRNQKKPILLSDHIRLELVI